MEQVYVSFVSALAGALIGSAGSVATIIIQARYSARRERTRLAVEAAIEDHKGLLEMMKGQLAGGRTVSMPPLSASLLFHADLLEVLEGGRFTPERLRELYDRQAQLRDVMLEVSAERKAKS